MFRIVTLLKRQTAIKKVIKMKYQTDNSAVSNLVFNNDGTLKFDFNGDTYQTTEQACIDVDTYVARLTCITDEYFPNDICGKVVWGIINENCDDEADACNWDKFDVYF